MFTVQRWLGKFFEKADAYMDVGDRATQEQLPSLLK